MSSLLFNPALANYSHTAINDSESFMWALGYLIIRHIGPGEGLQKSTLELKEALRVFEGGKDSQNQKAKILQNAKALDKFLEHVGPWFEYLKELMRGWCCVINLAHQFETGMKFDYPHQALFWCLDKALTCIKAEGCSARGGYKGKPSKVQGFSQKSLRIISNQL